MTSTIPPTVQQAVGPMMSNFVADGSLDGFVCGFFKADGSIVYMSNLPQAHVPGEILGFFNRNRNHFTNDPAMNDNRDRLAVYHVETNLDVEEWEEYVDDDTDTDALTPAGMMGKRRKVRIRATSGIKRPSNKFENRIQQPNYVVQEMVRDLMRKDGLLDKFLRERGLEKHVCHRDKINICRGGINPECGGQCRPAREALNWPEDLPLVAFPGTSIKSTPARSILDFIRGSVILEPYMTDSFKQHLDNIPDEARKGRKPRIARGNGGGDEYGLPLFNAGGGTGASGGTKRTRFIASGDDEGNGGGANPFFGGMLPPPPPLAGMAGLPPLPNNMPMPPNFPNGLPVPPMGLDIKNLPWPPLPPFGKDGMPPMPFPPLPGMPGMPPMPPGMMPLFPKPDEGGEGKDGGMPELPPMPPLGIPPLPPLPPMPEPPK